MRIVSVLLMPSLLRSCTFSREDRKRALRSDNTKNGKLKCSSSRMLHYWIIDRESVSLALLFSLALSLGPSDIRALKRNRVYTNSLAFDTISSHLKLGICIFLFNTFGNKWMEDKNVISKWKWVDNGAGYALNGRAINIFDMTNVVKLSQMKLSSAAQFCLFDYVLLIL